MRTLGCERAHGLDLKPSAFTDNVGSIVDREFVRHCMSGVHTVIHPATLHKPHIATHDAESFVETNIRGTLILLEEAVAAGVRCFIFTSTTSVFGWALVPGAGEPASWVTEDVHPAPKNIYGVTKTAAEDLCELFSRKYGLAVAVLRTSRFFPEPDDDPAVREKYEPANVQANELLYRRTDIADVVDAHLVAIEKVRSTGFARYLISATTPFSKGDLPLLRSEARCVVRRLFPECEALFAARNWNPPSEIDRVYVNARARADLGWQPKYNFRYVLDCLKEGRDFRSPLAREIGIKGYHGESFADGLYPVA